jgi:hypothetical protein
LIIDTEPDVMDVLKAIELHNKMQGIYKTDLTVIKLGIDFEEEYI